MLDPSSREPVTGKNYIFQYVFHKPGVREHSDASKKQAAHKEALAKPCQSAEDYYERGYVLLTLDQDDEAFRAFMRCLELDPLDLDIYEDVSRLYFVRHKYEKPLAIYNQALQIFPACAKLHKKRAEALLRLERSQEALDVCNHAIQLDDTCASTYSVKGKILHHLRRLKEALDAYDLAI